MDYGRRERRGGYGGGYGRREGGRGYGPGFPPKPVEIGKEYDVEIQETSRRGEGIARIKGLVVFVPNTKPGDKVKIRVTRISRRFCEAEVVGAGEPKTEEASETTAEEETLEATTEEETETETSTESSTESDTETDAEGDTESDTETM
jgi:predicted RNA-binding protein with TRAM domain